MITPRKIMLKRANLNERTALETGLVAVLTDHASLDMTQLPHTRGAADALSKTFKRSPISTQPS